MTMRLLQFCPAITAILTVTALGTTWADDPPAPSAGSANAVKEVTYKSTPEGDLSMLIHRPAGWKASDRRPLIVFFFGGGWTNGSTKQFESQAEYLAGRGMVAARAD